MSLIGTILGGVFALLGIGCIGYSWYSAMQGTIIGGVSYVGPFLLIVGVYRAFASAAAVRPAAIFRIVAVGIGIGAGYGNTSIQKQIFPSDRVIETTNKL